MLKLKEIRNFLVNDEELDVDSQKILSLIFLLLAGSMSFFDYTKTHNLFGMRWLSWKSDTSFTPRFISGLMGIVAVSPLDLRNVLKWNRSIYTIFSFVLILLVFSSFIQLATGGNGNNTVIYSLIAVSVVLSWLGIKGVAGVSWILLLAAAVWSVLINSMNLEFYGFLYVLFGFLGLVMHTGLNPGGLFKELKDEYSRPVIYATNTAKDEIAATGGMINKII